MGRVGVCIFEIEDPVKICTGGMGVLPVAGHDFAEILHPF